VARYSFLTTWRVDAPVEAVWPLIFDAERWPDWWPGVESVVEVDPGQGPLKLGGISDQVWKSRLPYRVRFRTVTEAVEPHRLIQGRADGDLRGRGIWRFAEKGGQTVVTYDWLVETTSRWMNVMAPLARPLFRWNHDSVMASGGRGLAQRVATARRSTGRSAGDPGRV
jgi:carbon monoxide dehydrogenase subunit G